MMGVTGISRACRWVTPVRATTDATLLSVPRILTPPPPRMSHNIVPYAGISDGSNLSPRLYFVRVDHCLMPL
jgi:hypothetical protein